MTGARAWWWIALAGATFAACSLHASGLGGGDAAEAIGDEAGDRGVPGDDGDAPREDAGGESGETSPTCGDGVPDPGEECDQGVDNSDTRPNACRTDCRLPHCGDRVLDVGEACDDGNRDDTDGCRNDCSRPGCGDSTVQAGEQCDDGNDDDTDACLSTCRDATCGDMVVHAGHEECDRFAVACTTPCASFGVQDCESCTLGPCIPPAERCNGRDDDCDTETDEGFPCVAGATVECTTSCGGPGTGHCSPSCEPPAGTACAGPPESCNARDDDCDTETDEDFECVAGTVESCTTGGGAAGHRACDGTTCTWTPCCAGAEVCRTTCEPEAVDDDCDTETDEDCPPCNDRCEGGWRIEATGEWTGTTVGADNDIAAGCSGTGAAPDVWYSFTLPERAVVWIDTLGSSYDTAIDLRAGGCPGASRSCNNDTCGGRQSALFAASLEPGDYRIVVSGWDDQAGAFHLRFQSIPLRGGDPRQILGNGNLDDDTTAAGNDYAGSCGGGDAPDVAYLAVLCEPRSPDVSTCFRAETTFDTVIYWIGPDGTELACNDDAAEGCREVGRSVLNGTPLGVGLSLLVVDGKGGASGRVRTAISHW